MNVSVQPPTRAPAARWWMPAVATLASLAMSLPLIVKGTPDVEKYGMNVFSTVAFSRNLLAGVDPFFVSSYGFGIPLPTGTWLIKFPPAIAAALVGPATVYACVWLAGEFLFAYFFLTLAMMLTGRRSVSLVLLATALLAFSNLGPTYVDDWPDHFLGWALFPASLWSILRTLTSSTTRERITAAAVCASVLCIFTGSAHQNDLVTFYSGMGITLAFLIKSRWRGVLAVGCAAGVALCSAADVLVPTIAGMLGGGDNPLVKPLVSFADDLTLQSYRSFVEPLPSLVDYGWRGLAISSYHRVPFFGLAALVLAAIGAVRPFQLRAPLGAIPNDIARMLGIGFVVFTVATLLPSWALLHLPRTWMYRDGQTVLGLLCAGTALASLSDRFPRAMRAVVTGHLLQMALVAAPIALIVVRQPDHRLFAYARENHVLVSGLHQAGVGPDSRVLLAGGIEDAIKRGLPGAGITWFTDFALDDIPVVNAAYRGALTPALGSGIIEGRYGSYETWITWRSPSASLRSPADGELTHLSPSGFDVLGITHVIAFEHDAHALGLTDRLTPAGAIDLPRHARIVVLRNDRAWSRAVLLSRGDTDALTARADCPTATIWCRNFDAFSQRLITRLDSTWRGASAEIALPAVHEAGRLLVTMTAGRRPVASVDGRPRRVDLLMDTFPTIAIEPGDRTVSLSVARTDRMFSSVAGVLLVVASVVVAIIV